ncbi:hypothetical protein [Marinospirillum sp.]|nr:hypothetical protein [Marinospirillum sp.]
MNEEKSKVTKKQAVVTGIAMIGSAFLGAVVPPELVAGLMGLFGW